MDPVGNRCAPPPSLSACTTLGRKSKRRGKRSDNRRFVLPMANLPSIRAMIIFVSTASMLSHHTPTVIAARKTLRGVAEQSSRTLSPSDPNPSFVQIPNFLSAMAGGQQSESAPRSDFRGTIGNALAGVVSAVAPGSCIADLAMTGYKNDLYDEDDYGFQPSCYAGGKSNTLVSCFPPTATVRLGTGEVRRMDALEIGDRVLTAADPSGNGDMYEEVTYFLHQDPEVSASDWVDVRHTGGVLTLSSTHLLLQDDTKESGHRFSSVAAKRLSSGDLLRLSDGSHFNVTAVNSVVPSPTNHKGIYAPVTASGTIFVDGVLASSYSSLDLFGKYEKRAHTVLRTLALPMTKFARKYRFCRAIVNGTFRSAEAVYLHALEMFRAVTITYPSLPHTTKVWLSILQ